MTIPSIIAIPLRAVFVLGVMVYIVAAVCWFVLQEFYAMMTE